VTIRKTYKYRMYPNKTQEKSLLWVLDRCRELYNCALQERKEAYEIGVKRHPGYYDLDTRKELAKLHSVSYNDQQNQLPELKKIREEYQEIGSHVLQDVLKRLDKAFQSFFRRVREGQTPGYPRFIGKSRYNSFLYPDRAGWKIETTQEPDPQRGGGRALLKLSNIGDIKVHLHRNIDGIVKTCTVKRESDEWYVIFSCEVADPVPLPASDEDVGIDLGVTHFATLSTGEFIEAPHHYRKVEKKLQKLQEKLSKKMRGSHRRQRAVRELARVHRKVRNQRRDFTHKASRKVVNRFQIIALEDLHTANLVRKPKTKQDSETGEYLPNGASAKAGLNKSILDAGWAMFTGMLNVKAAWAARLVTQVNPAFTSQVCSGCGTVRKKDLSERWHSCECGTELDRDMNAAVNILSKAYKDLGGPRPTSGTLSPAVEAPGF